MTDERSILRALRPGEILVTNGKIYERCKRCREIVRMNKWLIGSLHLCEVDA